MNQAEFNKLFRQAMEEYHEAQEKKKVDGFTPKISTPSSDEQGKKETPVTSKMSSKESASEIHAPTPHGHKNPTKDFIEVTPVQVRRMYYLLRDLAINILDPDQDWDFVGDFGADIINLLTEINPNEADSILTLALQKATSPSSLDHEDIVLRKQLAHELYHALYELDHSLPRHGSGFFGMPF